MNLQNLTADPFIQGHVIRKPAGTGSGYWVGAPGAFYDAAGDAPAWYLTYRIRRPRGVAPDRGGESRIARSTDGLNFDDIWSITKDRYQTTSIERSAIRRGADGFWRYYTSYVDPADARWCTAMIKADQPDQFDPANIQRLFTATDLGLEGVKDPFILPHQGRFYMFLSIALPTDATSDQSHETHDIYNTGQCLSATGLAVSDDLDNWTWRGVIFAPDQSNQGKWDQYCRRINSVCHDQATGKFLGFYDGGASHEGNYEERTALAESADMQTWRSLNPDGPLAVSPHASGSIRYLDIVPTPDRTLVFYEFTREDASHDLRVLALSK